MRLDEQPESRIRESLEEEVRDFFWSLSRGHLDFEIRTLKVGPFRKNPVEIHYPIILGQGHQNRFTADSISHILSTTALDHPEIAEKLDHLLLVPRFVATGSVFMSHAYDPSRKILASYFHPMRFHETEKTPVESRFHQEMVLEESPGLLASILREICMMDRKTPKDRLIKYVLPLEMLDPLEIRQMEELEIFVEHSNRHDH